MPSRACASSALLTASACLPSLCSFWASSSLAVACFSFGSSDFIFAAASRPSLIIAGHLNASAGPAAMATIATAAHRVISFFIHSPPLGPAGIDSLTLLLGDRFRRGGRMEVVVDPLRQLRRHLRHRRELGNARLAHAARGPERLQEAGADGGAHAGDRVEHRLQR